MDPIASSNTLAVLSTATGFFCNETITVRLIHTWESRNFKKGMSLMGHEMLLLDSESTAIQGFIPASRLARFAHILTAGKVFSIRRFIIKDAKELFRVTDHSKTLVLTEQTVVTVIEEGGHSIPEQLFRIRLYNDFSAIVDTDKDLYDVVGNVMFMGDVGEGASGGGSQKGVYLHLRLRDGEVVKTYLWSGFADEVRKRWVQEDGPPKVVLLTTINSKTFGGAVILKTTAATRMFYDSDVDATSSFLAWLSEGAHGMPITKSASSAVTKLESATIDELHQFVQAADPTKFTKTSFNVKATIANILEEQTWNYIACSKCPVKLTKTDTSLYCPKCNITNNVGVNKFRFEVSVSDSIGDECLFVIFDREAIQLLGKTAADLLQAAGVEDPHSTIPPCFKTLIGSSWEFEIQVAVYNLTTSRQTFTVNRIRQLVIEKDADNKGTSTDKGNVREEKRAAKKARRSG